jgi:hypothetical protein
MAACYHSIYCELIHNGDATTQNTKNKLFIKLVFSLHNYIEMHGQQNIEKVKTVYDSMNATRIPKEVLPD